MDGDDSQAIPSRQPEPATAPAGRIPFTGRLLTRLLAPYAFLIVLAFSFAGGVFLHTAMSALDESLSTRLTGHARVVADAFKPAYLKRLRAGDENTRLYHILITRLREIRDAAGVKDIVIIDREGRVVLHASEAIPIGQRYVFFKLDTVELSRVWQGQPVASTLYADDAGDLYKSGYAPISDETGRVFATVGVEAGAGFLATVQRLRRDVVFLVLAVMAVTVVISLAVARSIIDPLKRLVSAFGQVRDRAPTAFGGTADTHYPTVPVTTRDEMGYLTGAFNEMTRRLAEKDAELTRLYDNERARAERIRGLSFLVFEGIPSGVIGINLSARVLLCNPAAAHILSIEGYPFPETGIPPAAGKVLSADNPVLRCLMGSLKEKKEYLREDVLWTGPDGHEKILGITAFPLADPDGQPVGSIAIFSDLTEVARLQDQVQIQERLAALGELSAGIAHEIRNPLGAIRGFVELLGRKVDDDKGKALVDNVLKEVTGLNHLVTDFLAFAREPALSLEETQPNTLLAEAVSLAVPEGSDQVAVTVTTGNDLPAMRVDQAQVKKALVNLIQNGVTAMGGKGEIRVSARAEKGGVAFEVHDDGPGIPKDIQAKIFNPFFTTRADGTGLGLAIVNKVIDSHGGRIQLDSGKGEGTRFTLWFPLEPVNGSDRNTQAEAGDTP